MENDPENKPVHQPHDKLVKRLLSNPEAAKDILSLYLPKDVLDIADLNYLEMQKDSFIDDEYRTYAVDVLYKTKFQNEDGYIWCLIEHQRRSDPWMPIRIFKYMGLIWDHLRKQAKQPKVASVPLIYPLVIYNGNKPYKHSLALRDLIQPESSKKIFDVLFAKPFPLVDLSAILDETLRKEAQGHLRGIALLLTLKHASDKDVLEFIDQILIKLLGRLNQAGDTDEIIDILYYLWKVSEFLDKNRFFEIIKSQQFSSEVEDKMSTIAQQLQEEGREKGIEEGKIKVAEQLLKEKIGLSDAELIALVKRLTGLSDDKIKELQKKH